MNQNAADGGDFARRFTQVRKSVGALEAQLLGGERKYSRGDLARDFGVPCHLTRVYWRSMGFTNVDDDTVVFTQADAESLAHLAQLVERETLSEESFVLLTRALGFHMGRLAMWQTEAIVDEMKRTHKLSDADARLAMLESIPEYLDLFEEQVLYAFRRQLAAYSARAGVEVLQNASSSDPEHDAMPLQRAVGFADLVSFTRLAQALTGNELADVIGEFESICRDIISVGGGRVVKTVGDEIMFLADSPEAGAQIALSIAETLSDIEDMPDVRVGMCWGAMFSRFGDVFGPTVNLAARLEGIATPGNVFIDEKTARAVEAALPGAFTLQALEPKELQGIGATTPVLLGRGNSRRISTEF